MQWSVLGLYSGTNFSEVVRQGKHICQVGFEENILAGCFHAPKSMCNLELIESDSRLRESKILSCSLFICSVHGKALQWPVFLHIIILRYGLVKTHRAFISHNMFSNNYLK